MFYHFLCNAIPSRTFTTNIEALLKVDFRFEFTCDPLYSKKLKLVENIMHPALLTIS